MPNPRPPRAGRQVDVNVIVADLHVVDGHRIAFVAGFTQARAAVEFPIVPGTYDIVPVEIAVAKRPSDVIANA